MWYLDILWGVILVLGVGVIVFALGVGVVDLIAKVRTGRNDEWMDEYREWYDSFEDERGYYCDVFENIVYKWDDETTYNIYEIMEAMQSYIDGVRPMGKMKGGE